MSWLALVIVGVILLVIGYWAPLPPPLPVILQIIGWILFAAGVLFLILGLVGTGAAYAMPTLL
jgi:hypothetical protein